MTPAVPDVTVVIPVYNSVKYLPELLESVARQDIGSGRFDVVTVDDGSTDGSGALLDDFCASHPAFQVIHQDNSGRPGRPRNAGLRRATGRYAFLADADDVLAPGCLRQLVAFADEHRSDVVVPKLTPLTGRGGIPTAVYERTLPEADIETAFKSLFAVKLYRRDFLVEHDIWYPEGMRPDDCIFNSHVYVHARRISILADDDYYFVRAREDGHVSLSRAPKDPSVYSAGVAYICDIVRSHVDGDLADRLVLDIYRRKCLNQYTDRFADYDEATQNAWIATHRSLIERFVTEEMERRLPSPFRERSHLIRRGDRAGLLALRPVEAAPRVTALVSAASWHRDGLTLTIDITVDGRLSLPRQLVCTLVRRDGDGTSAFPVVSAAAPPEYGRPARYEGCLPHPSIKALLPGNYDVHVVSASAAERLTGRVHWSPAVASVPERDGFQFYSTKGGRAAVRKSG